MRKVLCLILVLVFCVSMACPAFAVKGNHFVDSPSDLPGFGPGHGPGNGSGHPGNGHPGTGHPGNGSAGNGSAGSNADDQEKRQYNSPCFSHGSLPPF